MSGDTSLEQPLRRRFALATRCCQCHSAPSQVHPHYQWAAEGVCEANSTPTPVWSMGSSGRASGEGGISWLCLSFPLSRRLSSSSLSSGLVARPRLCLAVRLTLIACCVRVALLADCGDWRRKAAAERSKRAAKAEGSRFRRILENTISH